MALIEEKNLGSPISIHLKAEGPAFESGIPLHLLTTNSGHPQVSTERSEDIHRKE